jgi:dipeptidyl aminopeptidase/acylaminoacyl peptidase
MPQGYAEEKYSICSVSFDPETHTFGQTVDTLFSASRQGRSASFPRVSPDGKYLLFTVSNYGNFSIWHKDADLYMIHLKSGNLYPLTAANSNNVESYHSWCSNSHWFVFSSRRLDGLYTRPFFAHVDDQGNVSKAFLLPQKDTRYYDRLMKSYNVPEFIKGKVRNRMHKLAEIAKHDKGIDIRSAF